MRTGLLRQATAASTSTSGRTLRTVQSNASIAGCKPAPRSSSTPRFPRFSCKGGRRRLMLLDCQNLGAPARAPTKTHLVLPKPKPLLHSLIPAQQSQEEQGFLSCWHGADVHQEGVSNGTRSAEQRAGRSHSQTGQGGAGALPQPSLLPAAHPFQVSLYVERSTDTSAGSSGPSHLQGS